MRKETVQMIVQIVLLNLVLYAFLVIIGLLGGAFKLFGQDMARTLAELTSRSRVYAILYVGLAFYVIPISLIFVWR